MRSYYEQYSVEWDSVEIEKMTRELMNFDILFEGEPVGVIRLSFDDDGCHLQDLQVDERYQGRGIGSQALAQAEKLAREEKVNTLRLKVFKSSPAVRFAKNKKTNISSKEKVALKELARMFISFDKKRLGKLVKEGELIEVGDL